MTRKRVGGGHGIGFLGVGALSLMTLWLLSSLGAEQISEKLDLEQELAAPGAKLLVVEFFATWCTPCMEAVPRWDALHKKYRKAGLRFVVVSASETRGCENPGWSPDRMICDRDGSIQKEFGVQGLPQAFLYSWQGGLLVERGEVGEIEKAVEQYFDSTHLKIAVNPVEERDITGAQCAVSRNPAPLQGVIVSEVKRLSKFDVVEPSQHYIQKKKAKGCEANGEFPPNSVLRTELWGDCAGERRVTLTLEKEGCVLAKAVRPYGGKKGRMTDEDWPSLEEAIRQGVRDLLGVVIHPTMPEPPAAFQPGEMVSVEVTSEPPGAKVLMNGGKICDAAPCAIEAAVGRSTFQFTLPRYEPKQVTLTVRKGMKPIHTKLLATFAVVKVTSEPKGAAVRVNGTESGTTPVERLELEPGSYTIRVEKAKYEPFTREVVLGKGDEIEVSAKLAPTFGLVTVTSEPKGMPVEMDGQKIGETPLEKLEIVPGKHTLRVGNDEYAEQERSFTIQKGESQTHKFALYPPTGRIVLSVVDESGKKVTTPYRVYIDGRQEPVQEAYWVEAGEREIGVISGDEKSMGGLKVTVHEGESTGASVTLYSAQGTLIVTGTPEGATVEIEGPHDFKATGTLPMKIEKAYQGKYKVRVTKEGYLTAEKEADIRTGEKTKVKVNLWIDCGIDGIDCGIEWVSIPGGSFEMGCSEGDSECDDDEKPRHTVTVRGFRMMKYEVTQGQYRKVMGENPSSFKNCGENCPVEQVDWNQSKAFCEKIGGRLPTEEEWEYAARGGTKTKYYCGGDSGCLDEITWCDGNSGVSYAGGYDCSRMRYGRYWSSSCGTHPVGQKRANAFGLFDMSGNVWEWTGSCWRSDYNSSQDCSRRVFRGGSWYNLARDARSSIRFRHEPTVRNSFMGLRCGRD